MLQIITLILIGLIASIAGSLVGIGGGIIIVPSLIFFGIELGILPMMTPQKAIGTSSVILIATGLSATISYYKSDQIDVKNAIIFLIGIIPGAFVGAYTSQFFSLDSFNLVFGLFLIIVSFILLFRDRFKPMKLFQPKQMTTYRSPTGEFFEYGVPVVAGIISTFVVGFFTGLFGIGGGVLMTPLMLIIFRFPPHLAVGTSMLMVFAASLSGTTSHIMQGNVVWIYAVTLIIAAFIGAKIGSWLNKKMASERIVLLLRMMLLLIGIYSVIKYFL